jgi:hypothetical protein
MNKRYYFFWILIGLLTISGCKKDDDSDTSAEGEFFTAFIPPNLEFQGGVDPDYIRAIVYDKPDWIEMEVDAYRGRNPHDKIIINIKGYTGPGTYVNKKDGSLPRAEFSKLIVLGSVCCTCAPLWEDSVGTVTITSDDKEFVEGTFSFDCITYRDIDLGVISNGRFRAKYDFVETTDY